MTDQLCLGGAVTDLLDQPACLERIVKVASAPWKRTLGVASINLEHLYHLRLETLMPAEGPQVQWLSLTDGTPLVWQARRATRTKVPKLSGADLILPILDEAEVQGLTFGVLGGSDESQQMARENMARRWPGLRVAGMWSPSRADLEDPEKAEAIARGIADAGVDILMVCLGKPRQEHWIATWGPMARAKVALAFGGTIDFLAGKTKRAPGVVSEMGLEWLWRLAHEPRRLARRYLIQCPPAEFRLLLHTHRVPALRPRPRLEPHTPDVRFVTDPDAPVDISILTVTYRNGAEVHKLVDSVRAASRGLKVRFVVTDNDSGDDTLRELRRHRDLTVVESGGNLGYAGGLNVARRHAGRARAILVLNPDLVIDQHSLRRMLAALDAPGVVAVVPQFLQTCGAPERSLRREPTFARALGDAVLGSMLPQRPGWTSETVLSPARYEKSHPVDWEVGAALMVDAEVGAAIGDWDERFFLYSEEVDYFRRLRQHGTVWYEADAHLWHAAGGSGRSQALFTLMLVNKVRYYELHHGRVPARLFGGVVAFHSVLRILDARHRAALPILVDRDRWRELPQGDRRALDGNRVGQDDAAAA